MPDDIITINQNKSLLKKPRDKTEEYKRRGRKRGSLTVRTQELLAEAVNKGITPLEFLLNVMRDEAADFKDRFEAAVHAAPYMHPRLATMQHTGAINVKDWTDEQLAAARAAYIAAAATVIDGD